MAGLNPDDLSPREAMEALYRLKGGEEGLGPKVAFALRYRPLICHGRACPGHPRLYSWLSREDVDARHKAGHDGCEARRTHKQ